MELIESLASVPAADRDKILQMCTIQLREDMENSLQELDKYPFHIKMKIENISLWKKFADKAASLMSYSLLSNTDTRKFN